MYLREGDNLLIYSIYCKKKYLDKLCELIQGGETAKLAFKKKKKKRGFHLMVTRKKNRKCNQKDKSDDKHEKWIMIWVSGFGIVKKFRSLSVLTRVKTIKLCRRD